MATLWRALRLDGWRRLAIGFFPLAVAMVLGAAHQAGLFRDSDNAIYDALTLNEAGTTPRVVIVRSDPQFGATGSKGQAALARMLLDSGVTRIAYFSDPGFAPALENIPANRLVIASRVRKMPAADTWRLTGAPLPPGVRGAASVRAAPLRGEYRQQLGWLRGEGGRLPVFESAAADLSDPPNPYILRLSRRQNLPQIDASQVLSGTVDAATLGGFIALVEPANADRMARIVTPRAPAGEAMTAAQFSAAAIQTLASGRAVSELPLLASILLLATFAIASGLIYLRSDPKRIVLLLLATSLALIGVGTWLALQMLNLLVPVTALVLAQPLAALFVLQRAAMGEDLSLRRFVTQTLNLSSRQSLLKDYARLPAFLANTAPYLGVTHSLVFESAGRGQVATRAATGDGVAEHFTVRRKGLRELLRRALRTNTPVPAPELAPEWPGTVRIAALGPAQGQSYWLYALPDAQSHVAAQQAAAVVAEYRSIQQLRADLGVGADRIYRPTDQWAGGAVKQLADHADRISVGLDGLQTAFIAYHPIGFPLHANSAMAELFELAGLPLVESMLPDVIAALTTLDSPRIEAMIGELLLHGGAMQVACKDLDTRARLLRLTVAGSIERAGARVVVVEAIDIHEPSRLAQLRLRISQLIDVNIRNDIDAIGFALAVARLEGISRERQDKALAQVGQAANRALARLEDVAPHLLAGDPEALRPFYPVDAAALAREAFGRVSALAAEVGASVELAAPAISGFTIADPELLIDLIEAMLQIVLLDSSPGEVVPLEVVEEERGTKIALSGGIGMNFERLYAALGQSAAHRPGPFRVLGRGIGAATRWGATVTYSSQVGKGYRFGIEMRRIG